MQIGGSGGTGGASGPDAIIFRGVYRGVNNVRMTLETEVVIGAENDDLPAVDYSPASLSFLKYPLIHKMQIR